MNRSLAIWLRNDEIDDMMKICKFYWFGAGKLGPISNAESLAKKILGNLKPKKRRKKNGRN